MLSLYCSIVFLCSYLANDIEEDDEEDKYEIFPWAMGDEWMKQYPLLLHNRTILWKKMGFRAIVSRRTCEEVCVNESTECCRCLMVNYPLPTRSVCEGCCSGRVS